MTDPGQSLAITEWLALLGFKAVTLVAAFFGATVALVGTPRAVQPLIGFDQLLSSMTGGDPDETVSSRLGKSRSRCVLCALACWLLDALDPGHCERAIEHDEGRQEGR